MASQISLTVNAGIAQLELNNPPLNLFTVAMMSELRSYLDQIEKDRNVGAVILASKTDKAFCAGSDIKEMYELRKTGGLLDKKLRPENDTYTKLDRLSKPTIAVVRGMALGGGLELAACCDFIVVEDGAILRLPEILLGWFPGSGGTVRISRRIGEARAKEMMFLGKPITADQALAWGLINRVAEKGQGQHVAEALARELAEKSRTALAACKMAIDMAFDCSTVEAIAQTTALINQTILTDDATEGVRAFLAKQKPTFNKGA